MKIELDNIYQGDCLELMAGIPDGSIDCVICDLPYEVLHKDNQQVAWDRVIPDKPLWAHLLRVTKENGVIVLFGQGMFTAQMMMSQPKIWRYNLIWDKGRSTGFLNAKRMPLRSHEDIMVFYRKQPTYNPQKRACNTHARGKGGKMTNQCYGKFEAVSTESKTEGYPISILHFPKEHTADTWHPTQKPVDLIRYLIRTYTNKGDTVLDATIGSGTTAVAAIKEGRHYVGFEKNEEYFRKAEKRITEERQQLSLDLDE